MSTEPRSAVAVDAALLSRWALPELGSGKHARGVVLVVGADEGTSGAVRLAGEAALRAGAGKLQLAVAGARQAAALEVAVPEALVDAGHDRGHLAELAGQADVVLVGPGLADPERARQLVRGLAPHARGRLVLDALALAAAHEVPAAVLTPNPGELAECLGVEDCPDLAAATTELAWRTGSVASVGAEGTWTAAPDGALWHDPSGSRGLGVSGSGDVRAGIVAGLLARGCLPVQAAVWAGWVHGRAGERLGPSGYLARDVAVEAGRVVAEAAFSA